MIDTTPADREPFICRVFATPREIVLKFKCKAGTDPEQPVPCHKPRRSAGWLEQLVRQARGAAPRGR